MNMAMLVMATCVAMKGLQLVAVTLWRLRRDLRQQSQQLQQQSQQLQQQGQLQQQQSQQLQQQGQLVQQQSQQLQQQGQQLGFVQDLLVDKEAPILALELCQEVVVISRLGSRRRFRHGLGTKAAKFTEPEAEEIQQRLAPPLGNASDVLAEMVALKDCRDSGAHFYTHEELFRSIQCFFERQLMPVLKRRDLPFVFNLLQNNRTYADEVIGPARVLQLAALALSMAKARLPQVNSCQKWLECYKDKSVEPFIQQLLAQEPARQKGINARAFAEAADRIADRAHAIGPSMPSISLSAEADPTGHQINLQQLQVALQLCHQAGFFSLAVRNKEPMATLVLDILPDNMGPTLPSPM